METATETADRLIADLARNALAEAVVIAGEPIEQLESGSFFSRKASEDVLPNQ